VTNRGDRRQSKPGRDRGRPNTERHHPEGITPDEWALLEDMTPGERTAWLSDRDRLRPPRRG
jgi:hypothetical protein